MPGYDPRLIDQLALIYVQAALDELMREVEKQNAPQAGKPTGRENTNRKQHGDDIRDPAQNSST